MLHSPLSPFSFPVPPKTCSEIYDLGPLDLVHRYLKCHVGTGHKVPWPCFVFVFLNSAMFASSRARYKGFSRKVPIDSESTYPDLCSVNTIVSIGCPLCLYWPVTILTCYSCYLCEIMTVNFNGRCSEMEIVTDSYSICFLERYFGGQACPPISYG